MLNAMSQQSGPRRINTDFGRQQSDPPAAFVT